MATIEQIRAARALKGWGQLELAERSGLTQVTIANIESGKSRGSQVSMAAITAAFQNAGIEFIEAGVRLNPHFLKIIQEKNSYELLVDDVYFSLRENGGEVLFFGSDERRSTDNVNKKLVRMRKTGIRMRSLIAENNSHILGPLDEYRTIPAGVVTNDVSVIYADKIGFVMENKPYYQVLLVRNQYISDDHRRTFEYFWNIGSKPTHSSAELSYDQI